MQQNRRRAPQSGVNKHLVMPSVDRTKRLFSRAVMLFTSLLAMPVVAAPLLDPQIRAAQFDAERGDPVAALARLQADRELGYLDHQPLQADLALGGMYLQLGLDLRAGEIFQRLTENGGVVADSAWFQLGRLSHRRGDEASALAAFAQIRQPLPQAEQQWERLLLEGELLLRSERLSEAEARLRELVDNGDRESDWVGFGRFNLAVTLFRSGRADEAREQLMLLSQQSAKTNTLRTLFDKANLTLAYDRLEAGEIDAAMAFFKKGRLSGPVSNTALMGMGRAYAAQEKYKKALVPWLKLSKRDPAEPLVQDALLAVPYGLGKLNAYKQALQYYKKALSVFKLELERIDKLEEQLKLGHVTESLMASFSAGNVLQREELPGLPAATGATHLWRLYSTPDFQELLRNAVRTQQALEKIAQWTSQVDGDPRLSPARRNTVLPHATDLKSRLTSLSSELQAQMQLLAQQELAHRRKRIQAYSDEVRFSIAQIYDYAAKRWGKK